MARTRLPAPLHALSLAIAMAVLADAREPQQRRPSALAARVRACWLGDSAAAGELPACLDEQLRRLSALSARDWARLTPQHLAHWLCHGRWWHMAGKRNGLPFDEDMLALAQDEDEDELFSAWDDEGEDDESTAVPDARGLPAAQLAADFRQWASSQTQAPRRWLLRPPEHSLPTPLWLADAHTGSRALPQWHTPADVAQALGLSLDDLLWLAPAHAHWRERSGGALPPAHHRHRLQRKPSGGLRLLEVPLLRLAAAQQRLLNLALAHVPVHEAAHGFVRGRSVRTHVAPHVGQAVLLRFDLRDFFTQVHAARVQAIWLALGHAPAAAEVLTRLCTVRTPAAVRERLSEAALQDLHEAAARTTGHAAGRRVGREPDGSTGDAGDTGARGNARDHASCNTLQANASARIAAARAQSQRLARPHLAQGAPSSPALANLCAFGLDVRLSALAQRFGARYSRYADDLVFSGPVELRGQLRNLRAWVAAIVQAEGFALNREKTRLMQAHQRQQVTGLVLSQRANLSRSDYDALKARLHRLSRNGPVPAAERARLAGQLEWARQWLAPSRQVRLQALFDAIAFSAD